MPVRPGDQPGMCRFTSALAGSMAARVTGQADVTVMESLAAGDRQCRLAVDTNASLDGVVSHRYRWPPPGVPD